MPPLSQLPILCNTKICFIMLCEAPPDLLAFGHNSAGERLTRSLRNTRQASHNGVKSFLKSYFLISFNAGFSRDLSLHSLCQSNRKYIMISNGTYVIQIQFNIFCASRALNHVCSYRKSSFFSHVIIRPTKIIKDLCKAST